MSTWGDSLGAGARPQVGVGYSQKPEDIPQEDQIVYKQWEAGLDVSESPENIKESAAQLASDVETDATNALIRAPGITLDQTITAHSGRYMFQQASTDFSTELVIIDPPSVGHKSTSSFTFADLSISDTGQFGWAAANVGGELIFSNGVDATYTRAANSNTVTDISSDIIASSLITAFGRVFAGAPVDGITGLQSLAVAWNATTGDIDDWAGAGSGSELLIANSMEADRVVAMVPLGLQAFGVLNRKSLWAAYKTGIDDRPADFQHRINGHGCVGRDTAAPTPLGIMYLSDDGVCVFDLNNAIQMSKEINALLLPLDYSRLLDYRAIYDGTKQRYLLVTPFYLFVYNFPLPAQDGRSSMQASWTVRSFVADSLVMFTNQSGNLYWNTVVGPWNMQTLTWAEMQIGEQNAPAIPYFALGEKTGFEDYSSTDNLGDPQEPFWITPQALANVTDNLETHYFEVQYRSHADAEITLIATNTLGELDETQSTTVQLPNTGGARKRVLTFTHTMLGMGSTLKIAFSATSICAIERVRRIVMKSGPSFTATV